MTISEVNQLRAHACDTDDTLQMTEEAFRALYDRTARSLWAYLSRMTGDASLADDLLQETYYRFLRANGSYESDAHRRNYLFRIATNLARDVHRRRRIEEVVLRDDQVASPPGSVDAAC
jgi:RNA polymerase sigma-70 factor (ECF subfamily)